MTFLEETTVPHTKNPAALKGYSLRWCCDDTTKLLTEAFKSVLCLDAHALDQVNAKSWIYILATLDPSAVLDPSTEVDRLSRALRDHDFLERFIDPTDNKVHLPAWTRAVAILTMEVVCSRLQRPCDQALLDTYDVPTADRSLLPSLVGAVEKLYQEACKSKHPSYPQAFYWLARALQRLRPGARQAGAEANYPWLVSGDYDPDNELPPLQRYFCWLAKGQPEGDAAADDSVLVYLRAKMAPAPTEGLPFISGQLQMSLKERLYTLLGGRPDRLTPLSLATLSFGVLGLVGLIWGLVVWLPSEQTIGSFRQQEYQLLQQLEGRHGQSDRQ